MKPLCFTLSVLWFTLSFLALVSCGNKTGADIPEVRKLTVEYLKNPLGIDEKQPRLAWQIIAAGRNKSQSAFRIIVSSSMGKLRNNQGDLWDSGKFKSNKNKQVVYKGKSLNSGQKCFWKVKVWDEKDQESGWSKDGTWSMGLLKPEDWQAEWIFFKTGDKNETDTLYLPAAPYLRKKFETGTGIKSAMLYVTALGLFEVSLNGHRIGNDLFTPGWTDYNKRIYYKTYDVSKILKRGKNAIGAIVGDGWYAGYVGPYELGRPRNRELYGKNPAFLCQLVITYGDGSTDTIVSDSSWKASSGPIVYSDLLMGEAYNANLELSGWNKPQYEDSDWEKVQLHSGTAGKLQPYPGNSIQVYQELKPVGITEPENGVYVFDMGQNLAGHARLKVKGRKNDTIFLRFGEMLHPDGSLMTENLRFARATDTYILKGGEEEIWEPRFTYHGYRYIEVTGLQEKPEKELLTAVAVSSVRNLSSKLITSDTMVNKLYENILWTQRSNFMDVPTDSPQRDERLGWLGDAQIFSKSAMYNANLGGFYKKWLVDVKDAQYDFGPYANFAPQPYPDLVWYSPGWMEAGVMIPFNVYRFYGDKDVIEQQYDSMVRFMDFCIEKTGGLYFYPENSWTEIGPKGGFGDWLSLTDKNLAHDIMASIYFLHSLDLMSEMSRAIGKSAKADYYEKISNKGKQNFIAHYLDEDGKIKINESAYGNGKGYFEGEKGFTGHTQTAYASLIYFDILDNEAEKKAANHLKALLLEADVKPTSGILGIRQLLPAISMAGLSELAYDLLLNKDYPGWGFEIANGATTIWERWNSYTIEKGFNGEMNARMNSFNHYAFGAVAEYLFEYMAGISTTAAGFNHIAIRPDYGDGSLKEVFAEYESMNGTIRSNWFIDRNMFNLKLKVPVNTTAKVYIPVNLQGKITEGGRPIESLSGEIRLLTAEANHAIVEIGSGEYHFKSEI